MFAHSPRHFDRNTWSASGLPLKQSFSFSLPLLGEVPKGMGVRGRGVRLEKSAWYINFFQYRDSSTTHTPLTLRMLRSE